MPSWQDFLEHAELTDVGLRRSNNQDAHGLVMAGNEADWHRRGHLFVVADGMGAHAAGELASKMAVDTVSLSYFKLPDPSPADSLRKSIEESNTKIHSRGQANPDFRGMGTTTSSLAILPQGAIVGQVGDSRAYRLRGNRLEQLSADHSLVWEMMASSKITDESQLPGYIPKNVITRSLGPSDSVQVDIEGPFPLVEGDTFLLCSDGLSGQVPDEELGIILGCLSPAEAVRVLVDLANLRGGPDNITVIVVRVGSLSDLPRTPKMVTAGPVGNSQPTNPLPWIVFGVLVLVTFALLVADQTTGALASGAAALVAALFVMIQKFSNSPTVAAAMPAGMLGNGPHRSYICNPGQSFLERMAAVVEPVCQAAREHRWDVDWNRFEALRQQSAAAAQKDDYRAAVRYYGHAISFLMQEVRDQQRKRGAGPIEIDGP